MNSTSTSSEANVNNIELNNLRKSIEKLSKFHQIEILKQLKEKSVIVSENNYGSFINMRELDDKTISDLKNYISYVERQENQLKNIEEEKTSIETKFFTTPSEDVTASNKNIL